MYEKISKQYIVENKYNTLYVRNFTSLVSAFENGRSEAPQGYKSILKDKIIVPANIRNLAIDARYSAYDDSDDAAKDFIYASPDNKPHKAESVVLFLSMLDKLETVTIIMRTGPYKGSNPHPTEFMPGFVGMINTNSGFSAGNIVRNPIFCDRSKTALLTRR